MAEGYANNFTTSLAAGISSSDTTLTLASATGAPTAPFNLTRGGEIIRVGARSGVTCSSLTRGHEGTTAVAHPIGAIITHHLTAGALDAIRAEDVAAATAAAVAASGDVSGPASAVDDRIATFDGTSGKLLQDGGATVAGVIAASVAAAGSALLPVDLASEVTGDLPLANLAPASAASKLLGRGSSGAGHFQEVTLGTGLSMTGTTLDVTAVGAGDVVGPSSSVDSRIAAFDGTTGKLLKDGGQTIAQVIASAAGAASDAKSAIYPAFSPSGNDDEFDDGVFSGWTAVQDSSPVLTLTETNNVLSIYHPGGDASAELHAWVKSASFVANDYVEIAVRGAGKPQSFNIVGLIFADGSTYGAGNQVVGYYSPAEDGFTWGSFTNYNTNGSLPIASNSQARMPANDLFMRWKYMGSNAFRLYVSPDGVSWVDISGSVARTLTPTHAGFFVTTWGGSNPYVWSLRYCKFGNG